MFIWYAIYRINPDWEILRGAGKVGMEATKLHAESEFEKYRKSVKALLKGKKGK
jgi:hypothetical protein